MSVNSAFGTITVNNNRISILIRIMFDIQVSSRFFDVVFEMITVDENRNLKKILVKLNDFRNEFILARGDNRFSFFSCNSFMHPGCSIEFSTVFNFVENGSKDRYLNSINDNSIMLPVRRC